MQFMIVAYDGIDEGALNRNLAVRQSHSAGRMIGSTAYVEFKSLAAR